jgi:hypothetical protein
MQTMRLQRFLAMSLGLVLAGAVIPFARDAAARGSDPRPALTERYAANSRENRLGAASDELRRDRLLLSDDAAAISHAGSRGR